MPGSAKTSNGNTRPTIGLALGGGGAKGISHIAFLKVLDELDRKPVVIAGASIGAMIGAFYAAGTSGREMEAIIETIQFMDMFSLIDFITIWNGKGLLKGDGAVEFLEKHLPVKTFEELAIPLKIVATDFWSQEEVVFQSGELIPAIRASISLPAIFNATVWQDRVLIDGSVVNPLPWDCIESSCDTIIAIDASGEKIPPPEDAIPSMFEAIMSTFQIMQSSVIAERMHRSTPQIYVKPELQNIRVLEFHRFREILSGVQGTADRFLAALKGKIPSKKDSMVMIR